MDQIEEEITEAEYAAWRKVLMGGAFILVGNMASMAIGVFFGWLVWGL